MRNRRLQHAFTLTELLIALAILGVIATFTVPKILAHENTERKNAVFKELYSTLNQIIYEGYVSQDLNSSNYQQYLTDKINYIKYCSSDVVVQGCRTTAMSSGWSNHSGFSFANGATVTFYNNASEYLTFIVDWNGDGLPNSATDDEVVFLGNYSSIPIVYTGGSGTTITLIPGTLKPHPDLSNNYYSIFQ